MRVVYRTLREELDEAIVHSTFHGKQIARFELTECEFEQLKKELNSLCVWRTVNNQHPHSAYNGIPIKVIE